jgi:hypothetical protein
MNPMNQARFAVDKLWSACPTAEYRLNIHTGRAWVTLNGTMDKPNPDFVLFMGDDMRVQAGQHVVVEAWPQHPGEILTVSWQICGAASAPVGEQQLAKQAA